MKAAYSLPPVLGLVTIVSCVELLSQVNMGSHVLSEDPSYGCSMYNMYNSVLNAVLD